MPRICRLPDQVIENGGFEEQGDQLYFCRFRTPLLTIVLFLFAIGLLFFAWVLLDAGWMPTRPGSGRKARTGYYIVLLIVAFPVWIRVPLVVGLAMQIVRVGIRRLLYAFDNKPDFIISPAGVAGWDGSEFRLIPWAEVSKIIVRKTEQRLFGVKAGTQAAIIIYGRETGSRRLFGLLPPKTAKLSFSQAFFPKKNIEVLLAIRRYCPDLAPETEVTTIRH